MKNFLTHITTLLLFVATTYAGEILRPTITKSEGSIPEEFLVSAREKYEAQILTSSIYRPRGVRLTELEFYKRNHAWINNVVLNGDVLFGNEASRYVTDVANKLLADFPDVASKMKFYVVNSPYVNAFATDLGVVFVNTGLLAKMDSEAQLAFVLSHEITHYIRKHNLSSHIEEYKIKKELDEYRRQDNEEKVISKHFYSKELEKEADAEGLFMFLQTEYNTAAVSKTFDMLQESYLPYSDQKLDPAQFTMGKFKPDAEHYKVEVAEYDPEDDDDTYSTHPSVNARRESANNSLKDEDGGTKDFLVSEATFLKVRQQAREQLPRLFMLENDFAASVYSAYSLGSSYQAYADLMLAKSILRIEQVDPHVKTKDKYRFVDHPVYHLENILDDTQSEHIFALGWYKATELAKAFPNDLEAQALAYYYALTYKEDLRKAERTDVKEAIEKSLGEKDFDAMLAYEKNNPLKSHGHTAIVLSPNLMILDFKKENPIDYLRGEDKVVELSRAYESQADKMGKSIKMLQPKLFDVGATKELGDYGILRNYIGEVLQTDDKHIFPTDFMEVQAISREYEASQILWSYVISSEDFRLTTFVHYYYAIVTSLFLVPFPFWLYRFVTPVRRSYFYSIEADLVTNELRLLENRKKTTGIGKGKLKRTAKRTLQNS